MYWNFLGDVIFLCIVCAGVFVEICQIKKIIVTHSISSTSKILLILGAVIIIVISLVFGSNFIHYMIGLGSATIIVLSENIYGITNEEIVYPATGRFIKVIGKKITNNKVNDYQILEINKSEFIIKFYANGSEQILKFNIEDREQIENTIRFTY